MSRRLWLFGEPGESGGLRGVRVGAWVGEELEKTAIGYFVVAPKGLGMRPKEATKCLGFADVRT